MSGGCRPVMADRCQGQAASQGRQEHQGQAVSPAGQSRMAVSPAGQLRMAVSPADRLRMASGPADRPRMAASPAGRYHRMVRQG